MDNKEQEPTLQYVREFLLDFCKENGGETEEPEFSQLRAALSIIPLINSGSLASDIAKYIAPEFAVTQGDAMVKVLISKKYFIILLYMIQHYKHKYRYKYNKYKTKYLQLKNQSNEKNNT